MKKQEDNRIPAGMMAHAVALAEEQAEGFGESCRRYRRWAAVHRCVSVVVVLVAAVLTMGSVMAAVANGPMAKGAWATDVAVENVNQMLEKI